jgi:hypothetical protein
VTIEEAVCERLLAISAVTALVSTRVYQLRLPQHTTLPAIRVQLVDERDDYHLRGATNLLQSRVQVDAYAEEASASDPYATATALADAIQGDFSGGAPSGLSGWQGRDGGSPPTIEVAFTERIDRRPMFEPEELRLVRIRQDYRVHWRRVSG